MQYGPEVVERSTNDRLRRKKVVGESLYAGGKVRDTCHNIRQFFQNQPTFDPWVSELKSHEIGT